jgi:hypothetical protein
MDEFELLFREAELKLKLDIIELIIIQKKVNDIKKRIYYGENCHHE